MSSTPIWSSMMWMTGWVVSFRNSMLWASCQPITSRANSTMDSCMPRQIPRNGMPWARAYRMAVIMPSMPRLPNPPGTRMPLTSAKSRSAFSSVTVSESIHLIRTVVWE